MGPSLAFLLALLAAGAARAGDGHAGLKIAVRDSACLEGFVCVSTPNPSVIATPPAAAAAGAPAGAPDFASVRRAAADFHSGDAHLDAVFRNALLDAGKQASYAADGTVYVKTGDIPAEWLRDSSAQVRPYLFFAKKDPAVAALLRGVIERQARSLSRDPYANAFRADYSVWEEKFELDSLVDPITLAWTYWRATSDAGVFTPVVAAGFAAALQTMQAEQNHGTSPRGYKHRELKGNAVGPTGMIWSGFRPSDDACVYNYLIPSEMAAVVALGQLAQIEREVWHDDARAAAAETLREQVHRGIQTYGVVDDPKHGKIYAYEVDGLGRSLLMDDGNIPSLLSAPYLGYGTAADPVYQNTRRYLLSPDDPYYYQGKKGSGIGSPHTPKGYVWPLALLAQGLTASTPEERSRAQALLLASDPGDGRLHESFDPNDPKRFTRKDFGWPNSLMAEFVLASKGGSPPLPRGSTEGLTFPR
jgi:meiotically up-regulated gene 157 (Mug157) protein